ncbi:MAG: hypothetical protein AB8H79_09720 [Myxococcota bacterium]
MRVVLSIPLIVACGSPPAAPSTFDVSGAIAGIQGLTSAQGTCLRQACSDVHDADAFASCSAESCAERPDQWTVVPETIRHEGDTAFVQARLSYAAGGFGSVDAPRAEEVYVGCTLITSTGEEIDLAVTTAFPKNLERPFTLSSDVGPDVRDVIFGVWDRKIEPCTSERMGCKQFGFVLDGNLATWPPTAYEDGTRQRVMPSEVALLILDGGVGAAISQRRQAVVDALQTELGVFGSKVGSVRTTAAPEPSELLVVHHADAHDRLVARKLSSALGGGDDRVFERGEGGAAFVVTLGGTPQTHAAITGAGCASLQDAAYDECVAEL